MDFKDKISEISKKIGEGVTDTYKNVADKSGKLVNEAKMKMKITDKENNIEENFENIGKIIYSMYQEKSDSIKGLNKDISKICKEILKDYDEIEEIEKNILFNKNLRKCESCESIIDLESTFCENCGKKQAKIKFKNIKEEREEKKEEIEIKEKVCPTCGTVANVEVKFCKKCGYKF